MTSHRRAFADAPRISQRIDELYTLKAGDPALWQALIEDVSQYVIRLKTSAAATGSGGLEQGAAKKRKLDNGTAASAQLEGNTWCEVRDASFLFPLRKKIPLQLVENAQRPTAGGLRYITPGGDDEWSMPWSAVEQLVCLPVPEKAQKQFGFIVFYRPTDSTAQDGELGPDQLVGTAWTLAESPKKENIIFSGAQSVPSMAADGTNVHVVLDALDAGLKSAGKAVVLPTEAEFASAIQQAHRKNEKAFHVKAFKGSSEGFLFFLSIGIVFAFKKPCLLFSFPVITSISYQSVLQRTFNLVISYRNSASGDTTDLEFSMVDQTDFPGIDAYVKRHGLNDASLAESRRAKIFNVNKEPAKDGGAAADGPTEGAVAGETELQRAERELQDAEDEEEEDFDPDAYESGDDEDSEGDGENYADREDAEEEYDENEEGEEL